MSDEKAVILTKKSEVKVHGGKVMQYEHLSISTKTKMVFSVFLPSISSMRKVPGIYYLSGLTCTDQNFITKACPFAAADAYGVAIIAPDTSPRGANIKGEDDNWDFGTGAGFYVDATEDKWKNNYNMYTYITQELPSLVEKKLPITSKKSICGHSMGGHGALICYLKNPGMYESCSAFAPICNPIYCSWGKKAFAGYLGPNKQNWEAYDATCLVGDYIGLKREILIDQGTKDGFLEKKQLLPNNFVDACKAANFPVKLRMQKDYDHSYFFIHTFIKDHIRHHTEALGCTSESLPNDEFCFSEASIEDTLKQINERYAADITAIIELPQEKRTFKNTVQALSDANGLAASQSWRCTLPSLVSTDAKARAASVAAKQRLKSMFDSAYMRSDLCDVISSVTNNVNIVNSLVGDAESHRLIEKITKKFQLNGLLLSEEERLVFKSNKDEICKLSLQFQQNINEDTTKLMFTAEELDGVPKLSMEKYNTTAAQCTTASATTTTTTSSTCGTASTGIPTKYIVSLKAPDVIPIVKFAKNEKTRRQVSIAYSKRCVNANMPILQKLLKLKQENAKMLGFASHSHFILKRKMAKDPETVKTFLTDIREKLSTRFKLEMERLTKIKQEDPNSININDELKSWDMAYCKRLLRKKMYDLDENLVKQYFPLSNVIKQTLAIYQEILGVKFEREDGPVWLPEVERYGVYDQNESDSSHSKLGTFFMDLFPRNGKYGHQCVFPIKPCCQFLNGAEILPEAVIIGNLTRPSEKSESLLSFNEVVTFFHEFGHVMHCVLTKTKNSLFSWAWDIVPWDGGVEGDFLETPSQMLENWVYDRAVLERLSSHYQTKQPLPDDIIKKLEAVKYLNVATFYRKQMVYCFFDLIVHSQDPPYAIDLQSELEEQKNNKDDETLNENEKKCLKNAKNHRLNLKQLWDSLEEEYTTFDVPEECQAAASFYHLTMGYDSGYYGYIWSEVYSSDLFSKFSEGDGCLDTKLGRRYRDLILKPCASEDGDVLITNFLGRKPTKDNFYREIGISENHGEPCPKRQKLNESSHVGETSNGSGLSKTSSSPSTTTTTTTTITTTTTTKEKKDNPELQKLILFARQIPKAELHLHFEGAIQPLTLIELASRHGVKLPSNTEKGIRDWFTFVDFDHFIQVYLVIVSCLRTTEDFQFASYKFGEYLKSNNILYAEVTFTIGLHSLDPMGSGRKLPWKDVMDAVNMGRKEAEEKLGVTWKWILDIPRDFKNTYDSTTEIAIEAGEKYGVVALGLGGSEAKFPAKLFAKQFERAITGGLASIPHGGEMAGPESMWDCINFLKANRIGHGVRCIEDPKLVTHLVNNQIHIEVCPTSNIKLSIYKDYKSHPLRNLWDAGVSLSVNSDDPSLFGATLSDEYEILVRKFGFNVEEIEKISQNAVTASLLSETEKKQLSKKIEAGSSQLKQELGL